MKLKEVTNINRRTNSVPSNIFKKNLVEFLQSDEKEKLTTILNENLIVIGVNNISKLKKNVFNKLAYFCENRGWYMKDLIIKKNSATLIFQNHKQQKVELKEAYHVIRNQDKNKLLKHGTTDKTIYLVDTIKEARELKKIYENDEKNQRYSILKLELDQIEVYKHPKFSYLYTDKTISQDKIKFVR